MRERNCDRCGTAYAFTRSTSRYCGPACRARGPADNVVPLHAAPSTPGPGSTKTHDDAYAELRAAGRLDTLLGSALLRLAARIDANAMDTGSALASMLKELRALREAALADAHAAADPLDELARIREAKRRAAAG